MDRVERGSWNHNSIPSLPPRSNIRFILRDVGGLILLRLAHGRQDRHSQTRSGQELQASLGADAGALGRILSAPTSSPSQRWRASLPDFVWHLLAWRRVWARAPAHGDGPGGNAGRAGLGRRGSVLAPQCGLRGPGNLADVCATSFSAHPWSEVAAITATESGPCISRPVSTAERRSRRPRAGRCIDAAHAAGMRVVAWSGFSSVPHGRAGSTGRDPVPERPRGNISTPSRSTSRPASSVPCRCEPSACCSSPPGSGRPSVTAIRWARSSRRRSGSAGIPPTGLASRTGRSPAPTTSSCRWPTRPTVTSTASLPRAPTTSPTSPSSASAQASRTSRST